MTASVLYYTCNTHPQKIELVARRQLRKATNLEIISVSRDKNIPFGDKRIVLKGLEPSVLTMHRQILEGLVSCNSRFVFLCENDVLYHPSHFDFQPLNEGAFYFNTNVYKFWEDGLTVWTDNLQQMSGLVANRLLLLEFFHSRMIDIEKHGFNRHYEPNPRYGCLTQNWQSEFPNLDIRHGKNLTKSHRSVDEFRNKKYALGFKVVDQVPFWGYTQGRFNEILESV